MIRVWTVYMELWHHNANKKLNICFHGKSNTLTTLTFVSLLDTTCRLGQNHFTSVCLCVRTSLKVQKPISQCRHFHTCFCHRVAVWKWSGEPISATYSTFILFMDRLTKSSARRFSSSVASRSLIVAFWRLAWAKARSEDRILEISSWTWVWASAWILVLVRAFSSSSLKSQYFLWLMHSIRIA